jgi:molecular chaperone DnaK
VSYQVGVDLGTTYTAAAVHRDGVTTIFTLGSRTAAVPSVVLLRADGTVLTGDAAERRANSEPERVVREFKRRFGDTTPIIVGGSPYSAEALTARLLQAVLGEINNREGGPPSRIVITHPANWGHYKRELLDQTVRLAGLNPDLVGFITEPEAAALSYAAQERVEPGEVVAVYDLGGGTFDAAVLRRTASGFAIVGKPEGIERLGGIDFDAAVFAHLTGSLGEALSALDPDDPAALMAVTRLRQDCVESKEALSSDTDAAVAVVLPTVHTEVRITRQEFEGLIRPALLDTIEALRRAIRSAGLTVDDVSRVLLVGGSSRIPLISQLVSSELRRPVAVDAHPKHTVALGAALAASGHWVAGSVVEVGPSRAPNPGTAGQLDPSATGVGSAATDALAGGAGATTVALGSS